MNIYKKNLELLSKNNVYSKEMEHDSCGVGLIASTEGRKSINDSFGIRRTALMKSLPYFLTVSGARAAINSIKELTDFFNN